MAVQITQGTQTSIYTKTNAGTDVQVVKLDIGSGTAFADFGGTITEVGNVVKGTITSVQGGTIGNLNFGTVAMSKVPVAVATAFTAFGTTGAGVWGTLIAASGAGTKQYVSGLSIVVTSGTVDVAVTNIGIGGSTGAGVINRGQYVPGGGIVRELDPVIVSGTNGTLSYWLGGAGTVAVTINYWQGV